MHNRVDTLSLSCLVLFPFTVTIYFNSLYVAISVAVANGVSVLRTSFFIVLVVYIAWSSFCCFLYFLRWSLLPCFLMHVILVAAIFILHPSTLYSWLRYFC